MRRIIRRFLQNSKMITGVLVQKMAALLFGLILCCSVTGTKESKKAF